MKRDYDILLNGSSHHLSVDEGRIVGSSPGMELPSTIRRTGKHQYVVAFTDGVVPVAIRKSGDGYEIQVDGLHWKAVVRDERETLRAKYRGPGKVETVLEVRAPMPGLVSRVLVEPGAHIEKGSPMMVLEAMKMENEVKASRDLVVEAVLVTCGTIVEKDQVLLKLR